jgi:hypothetical protein
MNSHLDLFVQYIYMYILNFQSSNEEFVLDNMC